MTSTGRRVLVLGRLDGYANGVKPVAVARFLQERGHQVRLENTYHLSRAGTSGGAARIPGASARSAALYLLEAANVVLRGRPRERLSYSVVRAELAVRRGLLRRRLPLDSADLVICETPHDALVLGDCRTTTLYDCPTPWADELYGEGRLSAAQHARLRQAEAELFESVDHLAFHWHTYADYAKEHYGISGANLMTLDFGCYPSPRRARFAERPRIVYLGSLTSRFIDPALLSRLSRLADIDVYGSPPDPALGLTYRGWASPDVLADYQLGLITCTKDELRRRGFSAKHLQYYAHGLPVLVPTWRDTGVLAPGTVPYDESTFLAAVESVRARAAWQDVSDAAYGLAERFRWDRTLAPLEDLVGGLSPA